MEPIGFIIFIIIPAITMIYYPFLIFVIIIFCLENININLRWWVPARCRSYINFILQWDYGCQYDLYVFYPVEKKLESHWCLEKVCFPIDCLLPAIGMTKMQGQCWKVNLYVFTSLVDYNKAEYDHQEARISSLTAPSNIMDLVNNNIV